jgi:hypothetical protein
MHLGQVLQIRYKVKAATVIPDPKSGSWEERMENFIK